MNRRNHEPALEITAAHLMDWRHGADGLGLQKDPYLCGQMPQSGLIMLPSGGACVAITHRTEVGAGETAHVGVFACMCPNLRAIVRTVR